MYTLQPNQVTLTQNGRTSHDKVKFNLFFDWKEENVSSIQACLWIGDGKHDWLHFDFRIDPLKIRCQQTNSCDIFKAAISPDDTAWGAIAETLLAKSIKKLTIYFRKKHLHMVTLSLLGVSNPQRVVLLGKRSDSNPPYHWKKFLTI